MRWEDGSIWKNCIIIKYSIAAEMYEPTNLLLVYRLSILSTHTGFFTHIYISVLACMCFLIWAHLNINYKGCNIERKLGIIYKYLIPRWSVKKVLKYQYRDCLTNIGIRPKTGSISWVWVRTEMIIPTDHDSYRNHNICRNNNNMIL